MTTTTVTTKSANQGEAHEINWLHSVEKAEHQAQNDKKMVFVELFSPKCVGCQNTEERTFSQGQIVEQLERDFVPVHYNVLDEPEHLKDFTAFWTPTFVFRCPDGNEHRRAVGFHGPDAFRGEMLLAKVNYAMARGDWKEAHEQAKQAVEGTAGDDLRHSEALYWQSVAAYKSTEDQDLLIQGWKDLVERYPHSEWAKKCDFVREM